jgi:hypothetical protein
MLLIFNIHFLFEVLWRVSLYSGQRGKALGKMHVITESRYEATELKVNTDTAPTV